MANDYPESWHLKKEVNVGHLLTTVALAGGITAWGMSMDSRVTANEVRLEATQEAVSLQREMNRQVQEDLIVELRAIRSRLDSIADGVDRNR